MRGAALAGRCACAEPLAAVAGAYMEQLVKGRYRARRAETKGDFDRLLDLRAQVFRGGIRSDRDGFDEICDHILIEDARDARLVGGFRILPLASGAGIGRSYAAQVYDLSALHGFAGPMVEMGRFCMDPAKPDPDILRVAWGAMTAYVDRNGIEMLFGCSSFQGTDAAPYADALALLRDRHLAPVWWRPRVKAPEVVAYASQLTQTPDLKLAQAAMPPLLRTYLLMGGWVSDHAVIDRDLGTLHVFTGLEIRAVPPARARLLRSMVG